MQTREDKTLENNNKSTSNHNPSTRHSKDSLFKVTDNRPEAVAQLKLQELATNSPQAQQSAQLHAKAKNYSIQQKPIQKKENNTGLPDDLKTGIENLSGFAMDDVKVHRNSNKPAQLQAHAYAQGTDIHLAPGQEKHLPHEAWHVVQQKQGRVKPTLQLKGKTAINDDAGLEQEADQMAQKAIHFKSNYVDILDSNEVKHNSLVVQRVLEPGDPAPTLGNMLTKRFTGIISSTGNLPRFDHILSKVTHALTAYSNTVPPALVTAVDCAKHGIKTALQANVLTNLDYLQDFIDAASLFSQGQVAALALNQALVNQIIEDQVKIALHDGLKNVINDNINTGLGISDLVNVIQNNTNGLTIPPQNVQQIFSIALHDELLATAITSNDTYFTFKRAVLDHRIGQVGEHYFAQLPGSPKDKMRIIRNLPTYAQQRFQGWENQYLKRSHPGSVDVQNALLQVNTPNTMDISNITNSFNNVLAPTGNLHLAANPQNAAFTNLTPQNRTALTYLLKQMPIVRSILESDGTTLNDNNGNTTWNNPAVLLSSNNSVSKDEAVAVQSPAHLMQVRIRTAIRRINNLISPQVLNNSDTPNIVLHKDLSKLQALLQKKYDNIMGFRAYANENGNQVNVGLDESIEVLMHEMGHLIEDNLGTKEWLDIQSLLHMRHANAPGGNNLSHVYDQGMARAVSFLIPSQAQGEPAYKGNMPATGRYSAKYYDSGSTEVMSMTIEHFGSPSKALNLIDKDPLQAAIILRLIQPQQFNQFVVQAFPQITTLLP